MTDHRTRREGSDPEPLGAPTPAAHPAHPAPPPHPVRVRATKACYVGDAYHQVGDEFDLADPDAFAPDYMEHVEEKEKDKAKDTAKEG